MKKTSNAVLSREMKQTAKRVATILSICVFPLFSLLYMTDMFGDLSVNYVIISVFLIIFLLIVAPINAASSIASEKGNQTYEVLVVTQMTPAKIVIGKYLSSILVPVMIIVAMLPSFFVLLLLGATSVWSLVCLYLFLICEILSTAAVGILYSSVVKRPVGAIFVSLATIVGYIAGVTGLAVAEWFIVIMIRLSQQSTTTGVAVNTDYFPKTAWLTPILCIFFNFTLPVDGLTDAQSMFSTISGIDAVMTYVLNLTVVALVTVFGILLAIKLINPIRKKNKNSKSRKA